MSKFTDKLGNEWTLDINLDSVETVKEITGVSLYELINHKAKPLSVLLDNPAVLAHVCYILAGAEAKGVDQRTFARAIKGPEYEAMSEAFLEELTLFFQGAKQEALRKILQGAKSLREKALRKIAALDPDSLADQLLTKIGSTTSGD